MPAPVSSTRPVAPFARLLGQLPHGVDIELVDWAATLPAELSLAEAWERCSAVAMVDVAHGLGLPAMPILWALCLACDAAAGTATGPLRELRCVAIADYAEVDHARARAVARSEATTPEARVLRAALGVVAYSDVHYPGAWLDDEGLSYALEAAAHAGEVLGEERAGDVFRRGLPWSTVAAACPLVAEIEAAALLARAA